MTARALRRSTAAAAPGPVALGDLVVPVKISALWPMVVVDAQYDKTGVVNLDTGAPKYFGAGSTCAGYSRTAMRARALDLAYSYLLKRDGTAPKPSSGHRQLTSIRSWSMSL